MQNLVDFARRMDETRLVTASCMVDHVANRIADRLSDALDIIGVNEYIGWYTPGFEKLPELFANSKTEKPVIVSEFGADAKAGHHGTVDDMGTEECQARILKTQLEILGKVPYVCGLTPWLLHDFRSPRRLNALEAQYNIKGMCSADKTHKKQAFDVVRAFYASKA